ncbi:hypothetical protein V8G54_035037 [Vigna mungo]|uniref:Ent-kaurene oxidase n=1 Tax=Vigna mungo TaxID=3915 RepID=A0AAQ3RA30_VIGMU
MNLVNVAAVPGLPIVGNLLQLKEKKPYKTFARMAQKHGPIYSIRTGSSSIIVLNSTNLAKESWMNTITNSCKGDDWFYGRSTEVTLAMVTRFSSISTRKLSKALTILTSDKRMVATSDYNDFHKTVKKHILGNVLGAAAQCPFFNVQKRHRLNRENLVENILSQFSEHVKTFSDLAVNFRNIFASELFILALKQALGSNIESVYVEELRATLSREDLYRILVLDMMEGAIEVDWRDFFPYLRWIPNRNVEKKIQNLYFRREVVMKALMNEQKKRMDSGKVLNCFYDYLVSEAKELSELEISMLLWETIVETSDTTLVTTEWAMYELSKDKTRQARLYAELQNVCGEEKVTEEQLSKLPYLGAVFHETLRKYSPAPIVPIRYAHEDTELGGYHIPAGSQIAINIYGCNMDSNKWENPHDWMPERFVDEKYDPLDLYKTMAFGAGKRAMLISCTAIGRFVQQFEWELGQGEEENTPSPSGETQAKKSIHQVVTFAIAAF